MMPDTENTGGGDGEGGKKQGRKVVKKENPKISQVQSGLARPLEKKRDRLC